ncbi:PLP-dependent aminotransferase family protein [Deinococcus pimensis]|uniref:aminotransferase-like domain-containing protein n=1 Tax=Deinococcus pimensis TaxID=309888 RepID=UPI0004B0878E|nr:PLP-dependent aminotransferase family protein [Deinococcus pimensis]
MQELIAARMRNVKPSFVREVLKAAGRSDLISFAGGLPAPELFDVEGLREATLAVFDGNAAPALQYGPTDGNAELRAALAALTNERGANAQPDEIVVTTGSQQGIDLVARAVLDPGDIVLLERPTYLAAVQVFELAQAELVGVEGDEQGIDPDELERVVEELAARGRKPKMLYVVATFANPSGSTLPEARRRRVLEIAVKHGLLVLEDDPYSELRFTGEPVTPMIGLARDIDGASELTAYMSSLSKVIAPGLRIGWMVLPEWLHSRVVITKQASDLHASTLAQHTALNYLRSGRLPGHIDRIREAYRERAEAMMASLERHLPEGVLTYRRPEGGMFLWASMAEGVDTMALVEKAVASGVIYVPGIPFYSGNAPTHHMRLSFVTVTPEVIDEGVRRFASAVLD